jgi:outer membrane biosynthesis protein TonB
MLLLLLTAYSTNAVQAALQELITNPERADNGEDQVSFVVEPDGRVTCPVVLRSIGSTMDKAVLTMTTRLPCFGPGRRHGQPVAVAAAVPAVIIIR